MLEKLYSGNLLAYFFIGSKTVCKPYPLWQRLFPLKSYNPHYKALEVYLSVNLTQSVDPFPVHLPHYGCEPILLI